MPDGIGGRMIEGSETGVLDFKRHTLRSGLIAPEDEMSYPSQAKRCLISATFPVARSRTSSVQI